MTPIRDDRVSDEAAGELAAVSVVKNGLKPAMDERRTITFAVRCGEVPAGVALDGQEADAKAGEAAQVLEPAEVVAFLRDLPTPWDAAPGGRRALAESLFRPDGGVGAPADAP